MIAAASDDELRVPWTLTGGGRTIVSMSRIGILHGLMLSHHIHHRGQFTVYLRMNDVPLPSVYGPTADMPL